LIRFEDGSPHPFVSQSFISISKHDWIKQWVDEDEQEALADDDYGNFGGMSDDGGLGGIDFSKLGAAGGMGDAPGMEGASAGAADDEDDDDDSEDMPDLEDDDKAGVAAEPSKPGIEEVS